MNIVKVIRYICYQHGITPTFETDVVIQDNGNGPYISEWNIDIEQPTVEEMKALEEQATAWESARSYIKSRANAYPSIPDQLDMLYWDKINGTSNWQDKITEIKEKYPKS